MVHGQTGDRIAGAVTKRQLPDEFRGPRHYQRKEALQGRAQHTCRK